MRLYVNKNFCGYRWFEIDNITNRQDTIILEQAKRNPNLPTIYGKLMTYEIYDYVFLASGNELILAIRGIKDSRFDSMGRHINIAAIFCEENNEGGFECLHKILLAYLSDTEQFSTWFDGLFDARTAQLEFNVTLLKEGLEKILHSHIVSKRGLGGLKYTSSSIYSISSDYGTDSVAEQLDLPKGLVESTKTTIDDNRMKWLSESTGEAGADNKNDGETKSLLEKVALLEEENRKQKRKIEELTKPVLPKSTKEIVVEHKRLFIITIVIGFILGLLV